MYIPDELITGAAVFAAEAHAGQKRKELNEPYIVHPLRVGKMAAHLGQNAEFIAAMYLHDVVEDTSVPMDTIKALFPERTVALVTALTKWWADGHAREVVQANKQAYYSQIITTPGAVLGKVLDRVDNLNDFAKMARMAPSTHKWAKKYFEKTQKEFAPLLEVLPEHAGAFHVYGAGLAATEAAIKARHLFDVALSNLEAAL